MIRVKVINKSTKKRMFEINIIDVTENKSMLLIIKQTPNIIKQGAKNHQCKVKKVQVRLIYRFGHPYGDFMLISRKHYDEIAD